MISYVNCLFVSHILNNELNNYLLHDGVDLVGTALGRLHLVALLHMLDHLAQWDPGVGHPPERVDLPQEDAEAPHIRLV